MNIKPGMICMVASGHNAGRECTVIRWITPGDHLYEVTEHCWLVRGPNIEARIDIDYHTFVSGYGAENHLIPLGFSTIVKSEVTEHDVA